MSVARGGSGVGERGLRSREMGQSSRGRDEERNVAGHGRWTESRGGHGGRRSRPRRGYSRGQRTAFPPSCRLVPLPWLSPSCAVEPCGAVSIQRLTERSIHHVSISAQAHPSEPRLSHVSRPPRHSRPPSSFSAAAKPTIQASDGAALTAASASSSLRPRRRVARTRNKLMHKHSSQAGSGGSEVR